VISAEFFYKKNLLKLLFRCSKSSKVIAFGTSQKRVYTIFYHTLHGCVCCKDNLQSLWKKANLSLSQPKTPEPIVTKFEWRDYVVDVYHQKVGLNPTRDFCSHI